MKIDINQTKIKGGCQEALVVIWEERVVTNIVLTGAMRYMSHMMMVHARDTSVNIQR